MEQFRNVYSFQIGFRIEVLIPKNKTNLTFSPFVSFGESGENVKM